MQLGNSNEVAEAINNSLTNVCLLSKRKY